MDLKTTASKYSVAFGAINRDALFGIPADVRLRALANAGTKGVEFHQLSDNYGLNRTQKE